MHINAPEQNPFRPWSLDMQQKKSFFPVEHVACNTLTFGESAKKDAKKPRVFPEFVATLSAPASLANGTVVMSGSWTANKIHLPTLLAACTRRNRSGIFYSCSWCP